MKLKDIVTRCVLHRSSGFFWTKIDLKMEQCHTASQKNQGILDMNLRIFYCWRKWEDRWFLKLVQCIVPNTNLEEKSSNGEQEINKLLTNMNKKLLTGHCLLRYYLTKAKQSWSWLIFRSRHCWEYALQL